MTLKLREFNFFMHLALDDGSVPLICPTCQMDSEKA
jgi:hypothetical protein